MVIRHISGKELSKLLDLYKHLHISDEPLPEEEVVRVTWHQITESYYFHCFGLFLNEMLISSCCLSIIPNLTRGCKPYSVVENVVTHPQYRRSGYGKSLIAHVLDFAWSINCYKVMVQTGSQNDGAASFYDAVGFTCSKLGFVARPGGRFELS